MSTRTTFDEVLDAVEHLPADQQADLVEVIRKRLAERGRQRVVTDVKDARAEFNSGKGQPVNVDSLLGEITS
jgi:hypothetical protein